MVLPCKCSFLKNVLIFFLFNGLASFLQWRTVNFIPSDLYKLLYDGVQDCPPPIPLWHTDHFELKLHKQQPIQKGHSHHPLSPGKEEINLPRERRYLPVPGGEGDNLLIQG